MIDAKLYKTRNKYIYIVKGLPPYINERHLCKMSLMLNNENANRMRKEIQQEFESNKYSCITLEKK